MFRMNRDRAPLGDVLGTAPEVLTRLANDENLPQGRSIRPATLVLPTLLRSFVERLKIHTNILRFIGFCCIL